MKDVVPQSAGFEEVEHGADVAIRAWAETKEGLYEQAAKGMLSLLVETPPPNPSLEDRCEAKAEDEEGRLVAFLNEILYQVTVNFVLPLAFDRIVLSEEEVGPGPKKKYLQATAFYRGEMIVPGHHRFIREIKSATYHGLKVERTPQGYEATIIFDV